MDKTDGSMLDGMNDLPTEFQPGDVVMIVRPRTSEPIIGLLRAIDAYSCTVQTFYNPDNPKNDAPIGLLRFPHPFMRVIPDARFTGVARLLWYLTSRDDHKPGGNTIFSSDAPNMMQTVTEEELLHAIAVHSYHIHRRRAAVHMLRQSSTALWKLIVAIDEKNSSDDEERDLQRLALSYITEEDVILARVQDAAFGRIQLDDELVKMVVDRLAQLNHNWVLQIAIGGYDFPASQPASSVVEQATRHVDNPATLRHILMCGIWSAVAVAFGKLGMDGVLDVEHELDEDHAVAVCGAIQSHLHSRDREDQAAVLSEEEQRFLERTVKQYSQNTDIRRMVSVLLRR